jgi:serine phosphatase RsbU (regulator of sigma subunit)
MADESALRAGLVRLAGEDNAARIAASVVAAGDLSWCMLPLTTRGAPSGGITLGFPTPHAFDVAERTFLLTVASNVAVALQRAQLFEEQRTVATMLQRALQPRAADDADSGRSWVEQRTAPGADVGGDWAELLPLPDGATAVVLGDVMGRGVRAARMMAETRAAVRTLVALDPTPAFVLHGLDRFFASQGLDEIVTLFYGVLSADGSLECISAGHLPPLVVSSESAWFLDVPATPPLGVPHDGRVLHVDALRPGEAMVLYSDGLVESRTRSVGDGLDALCDAAKSADHSDPRELCLQLVDSLLAGAANDDDVTLLAVRLP